LVLGFFVCGCTDKPHDNLGYLRRLSDSTEYSHGLDEYNSRVRGISSETLSRIEEIFTRDKDHILAPLLQYIRTYDDQEYPEMAAKAYGVPSREHPEWIVFHLTIYGTLSPGGRPPGSGGMRSLVDESYLAHVIWNPQDRVVCNSGISGGQCHALPPEALKKALRLASRFDTTYVDTRLMRAGWLPAWFIQKELAVIDPAGAQQERRREFALLNTNHNIIRLHYMLPNNHNINAVPVHIVSVDLETGRVLHVKKTIVDMGPRIERKVSPH